MIENGTHEPRDIFAATSVAEIHAALHQLHEHEATVTQRLNALIASQKDLSRELGRLDLLRANLGTQAVNTRAISHGMLSDAASTANRISSAVKRLDQEQSNVKATLDVVEQVAELKACVLGVYGSMGAPQDWETAAGYLHRASKIPDSVINGSFAEEIVPTAEVPDPPRVTLDAAAESLCGLFLREFEKATQEGDGAKVTRFFKLFPLVGRTAMGLDAYGRYVCQGVASRARTNFNSAAPALRNESFFYANTITKLFEHIAQIVDGHEPLVERHYGPGMMQKVIERLQIEADVQGGIVLDTWHEERKIDRKLTEVKSYAFSFLVQSFLPTQKSATGTPRSNSPANGLPRTSEDEGVNMKEVDGLLAESALILGRYALYSRFISDKCAPSEPEDRIDHGLVMPHFLATSNLQKKVTSHLIEPVNIMTTFFFRRSVEKAFQLDESPSDLTLNPTKPLGSNPPFITSAVDDVMYIVNQVLQRTLATSQRTVVASVVPTVSQILGSDFIGMIQRKMRDESYPKPVIQGGLPPEDRVIAFLVLINNLDIANDYVKRIVQQQLGNHLPSSNDEPAKSPMHDLFPFGHDATFVENTLKAMGKSFAAKSGDLLNDGITVLFTNVLKPRIRPILAEAFRDIDYAPEDDEDDLDEDGGEDDADLVKSRFDRGWGVVIRPIKRILTTANFDRLLTLALNYLASALESRIRSYYGRVNELGAVRLERDIAGIISAAVAGGKYGLRDAFTKCTQMTLIMNMEDDEWDEVADDNSGESRIPWVLDAEERKRCPVYTGYAAQRHGPYTEGRWNLSYARPIPPCRTFYSPEVEDTIERLRHVITDPDLFRIFENSWPSTLDTTIAWHGLANKTFGFEKGRYGKEQQEELTFVITGDIEAIHNSLASLFRGAINLQARYILESPFCNAFQAPEESDIMRKSSANSDQITPYFDYYKVFSCQWELDSVASFLQLSVDYVTATQDYDFFQRSSNWTKAVEVVLRTAESMMVDSYTDDGEWQHTPYTYCAPYGGTPINDCNGSPHKGNIGLVRSFHRPSDDACTYQYLIPSNMMFSAALNASSLIMGRIEPKGGNLTTWMRNMSTGINRGIEKYAIVDGGKHGKIYAFEIDGYGSANVMDDPNIPSLLSAPFLSYTTLRDPIYINTRKKILSKENPYYAWGPIISGIGSPHTLPGRAWPMALIMAILTSEDDEEVLMNLKMLMQSTDGLGLMHESVHSSREGVWSRQWFSWANGLFGQAILDLEKRKPHILKMSFQ
ncbi:glycoside hydrolase family 125 protein [Cucurbitaria berberidis CBS 394.84]|uniref:Conserved oligomeric Golgi complex subunit 4 n=1 Tax=Cucurbitaria berberidis CBS 394.84 TaxID=1168544 RepID=A0A9P4GNG4_9PLEO|nr:glycoside hydrolase family 125 protein [Cucurbitaria berberidis CBS 394.84]KAF1848654.1 glycoside hydrolase family 125 protein [Cucurbitaria berberidis CBS 394.84]